MHMCESIHYFRYFIFSTYYWPPGVVMVSAVPAPAVVLNADDVPGVPAVARVFVVAAVPTAVDVRLLLAFPNFLGPLVLAPLLLLASPAVQLSLLSCAAFVQAVDAFLPL
jgi:hypothetical protein